MCNGKRVYALIIHCTLFIIHYFCLSIRDVAQSGSVLAWGARGRGFESRLPDLIKLKNRLETKFQAVFSFHNMRVVQRFNGLFSIDLLLLYY